jgi:hypothetical protein
MNSDETVYDGLNAKFSSIFISGPYLPITAFILHEAEISLKQMYEQTTHTTRQIT